MYVDLNCIISSGIVYNLFTGEEKAEVIGNARQMKEYEELNNIDDNLFWDYIMKKVREKCWNKGRLFSFSSKCKLG